MQSVLSLAPLRTLVICVAALLCPAFVHADAPQPPRGFTLLFNGKDLSGWHGMPHYDPYKLAALSEPEREALIEKWTADSKKHWHVDNGELVNDGQGAYLTTDQDFGDMELLIEYKTVAKADSGIYLRATPQVQIWDTTKEGGKWNLGADKGSGGLWNNKAGSPGQLPLVHADKPFGEWNTMRILQVGERTTVVFNDKLVVDHARLHNYWKKNLPLLAKEPIQLQTHGGEIRWRNIFIRSIAAAEANAILRKHESSGFVDLFNGKDFTGWAGPIENYEVKDGAIVCRPKKGGNIYATPEFTDFVARVEYQLPPGGNNGLAIRYPGTGQPSTVAMCEIQILDDSSPKYTKLDPRQYNGSSYGMVPAQPGYLRPVGEWNFMEVTVRGPTIVVDLNGTQVLDADLSKVKEFMHNNPHPGKDRTSGHFGFCGHNDPVAFRNIQVKSLENKQR